MKKTIAILLVLVIGMVGVWAADVALGSTAQAKVELFTSIDAFAAFGVTNSTTTLDEDDFISLSAFEGLIDDDDRVQFTAPNSMYDFVDGLLVGYLHGINNNTIQIDLKLSVGSFLTEDDENAEIPLTLDGSNNEITATIPAADGTLGKLVNTEIKVYADEADIDLAPASENYEATVIISVTTQA